MLKWFIYGEVFFTTPQRRNNAGRRLDNFVSNSAWKPEVWDQLEAQGWSGGRSDATVLSDAGVSIPGIRFCYSTLDEAQAIASHQDIVQNWARFEDSPSYWGTVRVTV